MHARLSYANVVSTLALLVAVTGGGTAVAAGLRNGSVTTASIRNDAVTGAKVRDGALGGADVKNGSLGGIDIADGSVGGQDVADGSLGGQDVADGSLGGQDLAAGSVAGDRIARGSLTGTNVASNSLTSASIADGTISSADIADGTVAGPDLGDQVLQFRHFSADALKRLSQYWDPNPISSGSVLSGYGWVPAVPGRAAVSFPMAVPAVVGTGAAGAAGCSGSFATPTAAAGLVCVYVPVGAPEVAVAVSNRHGFLVSGTDAQFTWAYTAP